MKSLCLYCGSRLGNSTTYKDAAIALGEYCAQKQVRLVYGGASVGLMGLAADACLANGGEVVGIMPQHLVDWEVAHPRLTELKIVKTMHERKALMAEYSDAFLALPGGLGTLDELFEITTWSQLGLHSKPIGLCNIDGYFTPLLNFLEQSVKNGFVSEEDASRIEIFSNLESALAELLSI